MSVNLQFTVKTGDWCMLEFKKDHCEQWIIQRLGYQMAYSHLEQQRQHWFAFDISRPMFYNSGYGLVLK